MSISTHTRRLLEACAVGLAVAAMGSPLAQAEVWPNGRGGAGLSAQTGYPHVNGQALADHKTQILAPDDRLRVRRPEAAYPDFVERFVASHNADLERTAHASVVAQHDQSFNWGAAGIGASTATALLAVLAAAIVVTRRSRSAAA